MTSDDLADAAVALVVIGALVAAAVAVALGGWFLRQPAEQRPGIALALGAGLVVVAVAGIVDGAVGPLPDAVGFVWLVLAVAVVVVGVRRARR